MGGDLLNGFPAEIQAMHTAGGRARRLPRDISELSEISMGTYRGASSRGQAADDAGLSDDDDERGALRQLRTHAAELPDDDALSDGDEARSLAAPLPSDDEDLSGDEDGRATTTDVRALVAALPAHHDDPPTGSSQGSQGSSPGGTATAGARSNKRPFGVRLP